MEIFSLKLSNCALKFNSTAFRTRRGMTPEMSTMCILWYVGGRIDLFVMFELTRNFLQKKRLKLEIVTHNMHAITCGFSLMCRGETSFFKIE